MGTLHSFPAKVSAPVQNMPRRGRYPRGVTSLQAVRWQRHLQELEQQAAQQAAESAAVVREKCLEPRSMLASLDLTCSMLLRLSQDCREALALLADE